MVKDSKLRALLLIALAGSVASFSVLNLTPTKINTLSNTALEASRRNLLAAAGFSLLGSLPLVAFADIDDLSMPTADEQSSAEKAAMDERIRRKRELQKKASTPMNFGDSFSREQDKQKELKKQTKEERRAALCEELGRGC